MSFGARRPNANLEADNDMSVRKHSNVTRNDRQMRLNLLICGGPAEFFRSPPGETHLHALKDGRNSLSAADAHRDQGISAADALQFV